ncbi:MAG: thiamine phosphate synthase [Chloroflexi bacterium]|nr:thiamine phosphate synthase [Chloroflexota bacterium]
MILTQCLETASRFAPAANTPIPALQDLKNAISSLSLPTGADGPPDTLSEALVLAATARSALSLPSEAIWGETNTSLAGILDDLMAQLGSALRREKADLVRGLYVIIDPRITRGREPLEIAKGALRGGARMLQLRDKEHDKGESLPLARAIQELCLETGASLIVNDHADVAAVVGSAGMHVGQTDLPVAEARKVLAHHQVVGRSNHEIEEIPESEAMGADHVAFGPIYDTSTKDVGYSAQGMERLQLARQAAKMPLVAIGGITAENAAVVIENGADAICVTASVGNAPDPEAAAARLVKVIEDAGGRI